MDSQPFCNSACPLTDLYDNTEIFTILEQIGNEENVPKGTYLYRIGQPALPDIILLKRGSVKAFRITSAGEEHIYNVFRDGAHLFFLASTTGVPPALDFVATSPCQIVRIPQTAFYNAVLTDSRLTRTMLAEFSAKLASAYKRLQECESYNTEWKVCNLLLSLAERSGVTYDGKILIREKISQQTMASMIRISRITVARTLKALRDVGLIETINGYICIRDESKLIQHMHYISMPLE